MSQAAAHDSDVNVISWNPSVAYLLASGADDGCFKVRRDVLVLDFFVILKQKNEL